MNCEKLLDSLPQPAYQARQVQQYEAQAAAALNIDMYQLMEQAGAAAFDCLQRQWPHAAAMLVLCGKGNNGGDGYVLARLAAAQGLQVQVLVLAEERQITGDAATALAKLRQPGGVDIHFIASDEPSCLAPLFNDSAAELIVDALLGTGFQGRLRPLFDAAIRLVNQSGLPVLSVDIPSGLSADSGQVADVAVYAEMTVTFIAVKQGLLTGKAVEHVGTIYFAPLGLAQAFAQRVSSKVSVQGERALPKLGHRAKASHKGAIGLALTIGGNIGMPGAIRLASEAALRCGAGLVAVCCQKKNQQYLISGRPELMLADSEAQSLAKSPIFDKAKVLLVGPGLGRDDWAEQLLQLAIAQQKTLVIDADALYFLARCQNAKAQARHWVLTPHPGEAAALLGCDIATIEADRFAAVRDIANKYGAICVLKGAGSLISDGEQVWINTSGNAGMASGGMGDVLSGIIAALLLQLPDVVAATRLAVYLHGKAADLVAARQGPRGILASDLFSPLQYLVNHY